MELAALAALVCVAVAGIVSVTVITGSALVCMLWMVADVVEKGEGES